MALPFTFEAQVITDNIPRKVYKSGSAKTLTNVHWGQRKLIITEIQFLTLFWKMDQIHEPICVYAGAASGLHLPFLSALFPQVTFECYDPRDFAIKETDKIHLHQEFFTDDTAKLWSGRGDVFFISDIRSADHLANEATYAIDHAKNETEKQVWSDMVAQEKWVQIMQPVESLLKFRLPYPYDGKDRTVDYLDGFVFIQAWPPGTSTETRLVPRRNTGKKLYQKQWSILKYEQQMFWHNTERRANLKFQNDYTDGQELINDYDSTLECFILFRYLQKIKSEETVQALSKRITDHLNKGGINNSLRLFRVAPVHSSSLNARKAYKRQQRENRIDDEIIPLELIN